MLLVLVDFGSIYPVSQAIQQIVERYLKAWNLKERNCILYIATMNGKPTSKLLAFDYYINKDRLGVGC